MATEDIAPPSPILYQPRSPKKSLLVVIELQADGLVRSNLGRSIDHAGEDLQDLWVDIGVIRLRMAFVFPKADSDMFQAAGIGKCNFALEAFLLAKQGEYLVLKSSCERCRHGERFHAEMCIACEHVISP